MKQVKLLSADYPSKLCQSAHYRFLSIVSGMLLLTGCAGLTGVELDPTNARVCDPTGTACGISDQADTYFKVYGQGSCGKIGLKWGDGTEELVNGDFAATASKRFIYATHSYSEDFGTKRKAWPGLKTVHAYSALNCTGEARTRVNVLLKGTDSGGNTVFSPIFRVGLAQPTSTSCSTIPDTLPLRQGAIVSITELPTSRTIDFGCPFGGCINGINGNTVPATTAFPFPTMRRHSLVLRIRDGQGGEQLVQGSTTTRFAVTVNGPLEFCVNDDNLADNRGAWGIGVSVDESAAP